MSRRMSDEELASLVAECREGGTRTEDLILDLRDSRAGVAALQEQLATARHDEADARGIAQACERRAEGLAARCAALVEALRNALYRDAEGRWLRLPPGDGPADEVAHAIADVDLTEALNDIEGATTAFVERVRRERDLEWWHAVVLVDSVAPTPEAAKDWLAQLATHDRNEVRREAFEERDRLWCGALISTGDVDLIDKVTSAFNSLRALGAVTPKEVLE